MIALRWFVVVGAVGFATSAFAIDAKLEQAEEQAFKQAAAVVEPSVVRIQTVGGLDRVGKVLTGTGPTTGVVVGKDGYVISSAFNFISKPATILVELGDERRLPATIVASDRSRMLTLLKVEANDLAPPQAAPKASIKVGQWSVALGRTYSNELPNVSLGIVSALNRIWGKAIQTDAKISPMNYGGPLVDIEGRVMGILVPMSPQGNEETAGVEWYDGGIGFAVPMEDVFAAVEKLKKGEDLRPGLMGIDFAGKDRLAGEPVIDRVRVESPADKAGIKSGDRIVEFDGKAVVRQAEVQQAIGSRYAGDKVTVTVKRKDETIKKDLTLVAELTAYESGFLGILPARGASDEPLEPGAPVRFVFPESPAAKAGIATKDRIVRFDGKDVADANALRDLISRVRPKQSADVTFIHNGQEKTATIELAAIPNDVVKDLSSSLIPPGEKVDGDDADEKDAEKKDPDKKDAKKPDDAPKPPATGARRGRFTESAPNGEHSYWAYVPEDYNAKYRYGLMVWLHPTDDTMEAAMVRQWKTICDQRGIILLGPKSAKLGAWNADEAEFVKDTVDQFTQRYTIDPNRVFIHSFSSGGTFAWQLVFKYREVFRGAAVSSQPLAQRPPDNAPSYRQQFLLTCGDKDPLFAAVQATVKGLQNLKFPCSFTKEADKDHKYPSGETSQEIGRWADCLDRI